MRHGQRAERLPLDDLLSVLPSLPRPLLNRLVANLIECMDEQDGDCDREDDDPAEDTHDREREDVEGIGFHGIDQRDVVTHLMGAWREE
jgi:hypothetical protein